MLDFASKSSANAITLINIVFGSLSIISSINQNYKMAAIFILLAVIMDGLDGKVARRFNASSEIGKELDSLCDLVSFGVAPVILLYAQVINEQAFAIIGLIAVIFYIMCGAFRLARFNTLNINDHFIGIPITIAGFFLAITSLLASYIPNIIIILFIAFLALFMISKVKLPKF